MFISCSCSYYLFQYRYGKHYVKNKAAFIEISFNYSYMPSLSNSIAHSMNDEQSDITYHVLLVS